MISLYHNLIVKGLSWIKEKICEHESGIWYLQFHLIYDFISASSCMLTDQGKKCAFPFTIPGIDKAFHSCTSELFGGKEWCPHSVTANGAANLADKGFCDKPCPNPKGNL